MKRTLTVHRLELDTIDVSAQAGRAIAFGLVTVSMTDGDVSVTRSVVSVDEYHLGQRVEVEIANQVDD